MAIGGERRRRRGSRKVFEGFVKRGFFCLMDYMYHVSYVQCTVMLVVEARSIGASQMYKIHSVITNESA